MAYVEMIISVVVAVIASSGFWAWMQKRNDRKDARTQLLLGLAHDRIMDQCERYIAKGEITNDQYEDLHRYLYDPYEALGGNGTAKRMMEEVDRKCKIVPANYN